MVSLGDDDSVLKLIVGMLAQLCKYTKNNQIVHGEWVSCTVCELELKKAVVKKKQEFEVCLVCSCCWVALVCHSLGSVLKVIVLCVLELSLSAGHPQLERRHRDFTSPGSKKLYFDTHALVCLLEENGNPFSLVTQCHRTAP